ncbi:MAG TPA: lysophospholipid acyltransferase family protein [Xanthobacteraceae bacterium]|nr:lysophospholipid acyltransferase family protein [Xanthobacteraceae bacterium]
MLGSIFAVIVILIATIVGIPLQWISIKLGLPLRRWIPSFYHRIILSVLGIRVNVRGTPTAERPLLLVSNHSSWIDILALSSLMPLKFIAKSEIAGWPLFGLLAKLQRSVFVNRSRRQATVEVNREIASRLSEGDPVVLFGEGTSGDGNRVMPFRTALLGAMEQVLGEGGRGFLQPVSVSYTRLHGIPMGRQHRAIAAWYGDISLVPHLVRVFRTGAIDVVVTFGPPITVEANADRKTLALSLEQAVRRMNSTALAGRAEIAHVSNALGDPAEPVSLASETR